MVVPLLFLPSDLMKPTLDFIETEEGRVKLSWALSKAVDDTVPHSHNVSSSTRV